MAERNADILIIGGGVIGAACAYQLAQRGVAAVLIDRDEIGMGSSYDNAGLIVPGFSLPLPRPGVLRQAWKWTLQADSPLYIKPRLSWKLVSWLTRFMRYSTTGHLHRAIAALAPLANESFRLYEKFAANYGPEMGYHKKGRLNVYGPDFDSQREQLYLELLAGHGILGKMLSPEQVHHLEPSIIGPVTAGVYFEEEAHAEPFKIVQTLAKGAADSGITILPRTEVIGFESRGRHLQTVLTTRGPIRVDQVVLAAGAWSPLLGHDLRLPLPIQAGKGYAITVEPFEPVPTIPMILNEAHVAITPRDGSVKLAGTMELAGLNESVNLRRLEAILRGARQYVNLPDPAQVVEIWRGLRPCTPDGLPIIGRPGQWDNLIVAAGHAMLGMTLAPATGRVVAEMLTGHRPFIDLAPFCPSRF